ncbi:MAG: hypothetical protein IJR68_02760, partial [Fretibacterium sp.]|nr:hypothetical protein [Fretibacterium sp.]
MSVDNGPSESVYSGRSRVRFTPGMTLQYTVEANNGQVQNYWVSFLTPVEGRKLYVSGEGYTEKSGTVVRQFSPKTEEDFHDILIANVSKDKLKDIHIKATDLKGVKVNEYWTILSLEDTDNSLGPFNSTKINRGDSDEMSNLAKIRLQPDWTEGKVDDISGTLTIYTIDEDTEVNLVDIILTGHAGVPEISSTLPDAVKYVYYGGLLRQNVMGKADLSFKVVEGDLPSKLQLIPESGIIDGIPLEWKEEPYTFKVQLTVEYDDGSLITSEPTECSIKVAENTDENINKVNLGEYGYAIEKVGDTEARIPNHTNKQYADRTMISVGEFSEFMELSVDGVKLEKDVDYTVEEGSTKITIQAQTFANASKIGVGSHTLSAKFETNNAGADSIKTKSTSQNFTITEDSSNPSNPSNPSSDNDSSSDSDSSSSGSSSGGGSSGTTPSTGTSGSSNAPVEVKYTVSDGVANVTAPTAAELSTLALQAQNGTIEIGLTGNGETVTSVSLPAGMLEALSDAVERNPSASRVTLELSTGALQLDDVTLAAIAEEANGESVQMSLEEKPVSELNEAQRAALEGLNVEKVISALISAGEKAINGFHG